MLTLNRRDRQRATPGSSPGSRPRRGRFIWPSLLLLLIAGAPALQVPDPPGPVIVGKMGTVAAGDTLVYTYSWGAAARATNYLVTTNVAQTNGTWTLVADSNTSGKWLMNAPLPSPATGVGGVSFTTLRQWLSAVPWDSATFTVSVVARNSIGSSATVSTSWRVLRRPGLPGPILVDSSLIVTGLLVQPPTMTLVLAHSARMCAYPQFWGGAIATQTGALGCDSLRPPLWMLPSVAQQAHTDSMCFLWATSDPAVATVTAAPCTVGLRPALIWRVAERHGRFVGVQP